MKIRQLYQACALSSLLLSNYAISQPQTSVSQADSLVAQWITIEQQSNTLRSQWRENKRLLEQRLFLLQSEKEQLSSLTISHSQQGDDVALAREKLLTLQSSMESQQAALGNWLTIQFSHISNIHRQLPPPLAISWQNTLDQLDSNDQSKRLQSLLNLYQSYDEFNSRVSSQQATIVDSQGQEKMVKQLFLGAARGWYLTLDGKQAVAGFPSVNGWQWQHDKPMPAQQIKHALLMLEHKMEAQLITLPLSLNNAVAGKQ